MPFTKNFFKSPNRTTATPSYTPTPQSGYAAYGTAAAPQRTGYDQAAYQTQSYASKLMKIFHRILL